MIDITKKYRTRDGFPVRLLCIDGPDTDYPVIGFVDGNISTFEWGITGKYFPDKNLDSEKDLIEEKEKLVVRAWINIIQELHSYPTINVYWSEREAKNRCEIYRNKNDYKVLIEAEPYVREFEI